MVSKVTSLSKWHLMHMPHPSLEISSKAHIFALCKSTCSSIIWAWWYSMLSNFEFRTTKMLRGTFGAPCGMQISHIKQCTNRWITIWRAMWRGSEILLDSEATVVWCSETLHDSDSQWRKLQEGRQHALRWLGVWVSWGANLSRTDLQEQNCVRRKSHEL